MGQRTNPPLGVIINDHWLTRMLDVDIMSTVDVDSISTVDVNSLSTVDVYSVCVGGG